MGNRLCDYGMTMKEFYLSLSRSQPVGSSDLMLRRVHSTPSKSPWWRRSWRSWKKRWPGFFCSKRTFDSIFGGDQPPARLVIKWVMGYTTQSSSLYALVDYITRWWQLKAFICSPRNLGEDEPIFGEYFSIGLKPPTRHPGRLTWNLKMMVRKMMFLFNWVIVRFQPLIFRGVAQEIQRLNFAPWLGNPSYGSSPKTNSLFGRLDFQGMF